MLASRYNSPCEAASLEDPYFCFSSSFIVLPKRACHAPLGRMAVQGLLMPVAGLMKVCCIMMIPSPLLHGNSSPAQVRYLGDKTDIDSPFFKLHYQTSATVCFISCLLVQNTTYKRVVRHLTVHSRSVSFFFFRSQLMISLATPLIASMAASQEMYSTPTVGSCPRSQYPVGVNMI